MELITKAVIVKDIPEIFSISIDEKTHIIVKKRLKLEKQKIIEIFKTMKQEGNITSITHPRDTALLRQTKSNKFKKSKTELQKKIDNLVKAKQTIDNSIKEISLFFS